ncbi:CheY-like chemotaxis protein [Microvirga flocculans]|uniref:CheY-like chemotaxis protein n=1 Tax=Microvirga flocculans TaxID=217168 RepID=A0A7W6IEF4_9HYPH|nr:response regulator [Microvirga flocculans]MBB4039953.1 CheY-like chemotaxis protein [Microvirga flocculans]
MAPKEEPVRVALIVEDDSEVRGLAAALLEETDLKVVEAASAQEAFDYLRQNADQVAFLFTDMHLSNLTDGSDLVRTVRLNWPWVRTVVTAGWPVDPLFDDMPGDVRFMPKPWRALDVLMEAERAAQAYRRD